MEALESVFLNVDKHDDDDVAHGLGLKMRGLNNSDTDFEFLSKVGKIESMNLSLHRRNERIIMSGNYTEKLTNRFTKY